MTQTDISRETVENWALALESEGFITDKRTAAILRAQSTRIADLEAQLSTIAAKASKAMQEEAVQGVCEFVWRDLQYHLSDMYPKVWAAIPQSCRNSLRGFLVNYAAGEEARIRAINIDAIMEKVRE